MNDLSYITNSHPAYIENLYRDFLKDPESVDEDMRKFFEGFDFAISNANGNGKSNDADVAASPIIRTEQIEKELAVYQLILAYRNKGHLIAKTNPIRERKDRKANLDLHYFNLDEKDLETEFYSGKFAGMGKVTLQTIISHLKKCYTGSLGAEFGSLNDSRKIDWIID